MIEPLWKPQPILANRIRARIERILEWSTIRGYRAGDNPAKWRGHLRGGPYPRLNKVCQGRTSRRRYPTRRLPEFMAALRGRSGVGVLALEFPDFDGGETGETIAATWDEFNLEDAFGSSSPERMKAANKNIVFHFSDRAIEILAALPREAKYVFIGARKGQHISDVAMIKTLRRMGRDGAALHDDLTVHGFRSTFRDWAAERTHHDNIVVEMALAHAVGNKGRGRLPSRQLVSKAPPFDGRLGGLLLR